LFSGLYSWVLFIGKPAQAKVKIKSLRLKDFFRIENGKLKIEN